MRLPGRIGMLVVSFVVLAGCTDEKTTTMSVDARADGVQVAVTDGQVVTRKDGSPDLVLAMDGKAEVASAVDLGTTLAGKDAPLVDAPVDASAIDVSGDTSPASDAAVRCPASTPGEYTSPCPAGAFCEYSMALPCEAGCSGGSYLRFECINNIWTVTRRTSGAPVCYCPPDRG
jgi:hypothetical protein